MLEKPTLSEDQIVARVSQAYALPVSRLAFLPIGADIHTAVYRVDTKDERTFFLKLRRRFEPNTARIPRFLFDSGIRQVLAPLKTRDGALWAVGPEEYTCILYPWIDGRSGFEQELTGRQWVAFGAALKKVHTTALPVQLRKPIPVEDFSPRYRQAVSEYQALVERQTFADPLADRMARFMRAKHDLIRHLTARAGQLAEALQSQSLERVLCHADIHAGNLLLSDNERFSIVDWDDCLLAPKERDLMFIGGGVGGAWLHPGEAAPFYEGYGQTGVNRTALTYYRYERIVEDIASFCEEILLTAGDSIDRKQWFGYFSSQFSPGAVIDIACRTDQELLAE